MRESSVRIWAVIVLATFTGCNVHTTGFLSTKGMGLSPGKGVPGSGVIKSETRSVSGFSSVTLSGVGKVVVTQNGREAVKVSAEDNLLPLLETQVVNGNLIIGTKPGATLKPTKPIVVDIDVKMLTSLVLSGAGDLQANKIDGKELSAALSGAGNITLSGQVNNLTLTLSGVGNFAGEDLQAQEATVDSSGAGHVTVNASKQLKVTLSGVGNVEYLGSPTVEKNISGIGKVTPRQ